MAERHGQIHGNEEWNMTQRTIQDWSESHVNLKFNDHRDVKYRVYREGETVYQEIRSQDERPIHTLEFPDGMKLDKNSYEVLLRYVLLDIMAA
jgi:hypothetical protein